MIQTLLEAYQICLNLWMPSQTSARKPKIIPLKGKKPLLFNFGLICPKVKFPLQKILVRATNQDVLLLATLQYAN